MQHEVFPLLVRYQGKKNKAGMFGFVFLLVSWVPGSCYHLGQAPQTRENTLFISAEDTPHNPGEAQAALRQVLCT